MKNARVGEMLFIVSDAAFDASYGSSLGSDLLFVLSPPAGYGWGATTRNTSVRDSVMLQAVQLRRWCSYGQHSIRTASGDAYCKTSTRWSIPTPNNEIASDLRSCHYPLPLPILNLKAEANHLYKRWHCTAKYK